MKNIDNTDREFVHLFIALRRKKDNPELPQACMREIIYDETSLGCLEERIKARAGSWRIHKTINKRSTEKAINLLQHKIFDNPTEVAQRLYSTWKTCLLLPKSKAERNILLDIDSEEAYRKVAVIIQKEEIPIVHYRPSVSGHHFVINAKEVDTRLFQNIEDVTFQRDGYMYIKTINDCERNKKENI